MFVCSLWYNTQAKLWPTTIRKCYASPEGTPYRRLFLKISKAPILFPHFWVFFSKLGLRKIMLKKFKHFRKRSYIPYLKSLRLEKKLAPLLYLTSKVYISQNGRPFNELNYESIYIMKWSPLTKGLSLESSYIKKSSPLEKLRGEAPHVTKKNKVFQMLLWLELFTVSTTDTQPNNKKSCKVFPSICYTCETRKEWLNGK